jgi:hypothetical protein
MLFGWSSEEAWDGRDRAAVCMAFPDWSVMAVSHLFSHSTCPTHLMFHNLSTLIIFGTEEMLQSFSLRGLFLCLGSKYSPRHPVLKQHEPVFFPRSITPILIRKQARLLFCRANIYINLAFLDRRYKLCRNMHSGWNYTLFWICDQ